MRHQNYLAALLAVFVSHAVVAGADGTWRFDIVAETGKEFSKFDNLPAISCTGDVAFPATTPAGSGMYRGNAGSVSAVHQSNGPGNSYGPPVMAANGDLAFWYSSAVVPFKPQKAAMLIESNGSLHEAFGNQPGASVDSYAISSGGVIAYTGALAGGESAKRGLFAFDGRRSNLVVDRADRTFKDVASNGIDINDNGQLVFTGTLQNGTHGVFLASLAGVKAIADTSAGIETYLYPVVNNVGDVAVFGYVRIDERRSMPNIYLIRNGVLKPIGGDKYPFVGGRVSLNDAGAAIFMAAVEPKSDRMGIYYGPDPAQHKLVATGDRIAGREVKTINFSNSALSNRGQAALLVDFVDGATAIVLATPAPGTLPEVPCPVPATELNIVAGTAAAATVNSRPAVGGDAAIALMPNPFALLQDEMPESAWIEAEKQRYAGLLAMGHYDTLVVPFLPDGDTLDAAGRTLLARVLADNLERAGAGRIPDPGLVEKALGAPLRYVAPEKIFQLAQKLKVGSVIVGHVGHDRNYRMTVSVDIYKDESGSGISESSAHKRLAQADIEFSATNDPYMVFTPIAALWAAEISGKKPTRSDSGAQKLAAVSALPSSFEDLVGRSAQSRLEEARQLIFLGSLYPWTIDSRSRDHLFERALLALESVNDESGGYRVLKSQALIALNRRPASLKALGNARTPEEKALLAYLNSDLPGLDENIPLIQDKSLQLFAILNRQRLRFEFKMPLDRDKVAEIPAAYPEWGALVLQRYVDGDGWGQMSDILTKAGLDQLVPDVAPNLEELAATMSPRSQSDVEVEIAHAVMSHINTSFTIAAEGKSADRLYLTAPRLIDLLNLAEDLTLANVLSKSRANRGPKGRADAALEVLNSYADLFAANPQFAMEEGFVYRSPSLQKSNGRTSRADSVERGNRLCAEAFVWNPVQNQYTHEVSLMAESYFPSLSSLSDAAQKQALFRYDFPASFDGLYYASAENDADTKALARQCLDYTLSNVTCARSYQTAAAALASAPAASAKSAQQMLQELEGRFIGSPDRLEVITWLQQQSDPDFSEVDAYRQAIAAGATDWKPYEEVGVALAKSGDYAAALGAFIQYPGFNGKAVVGRVALSNYAYDAGSNLYWRGAWEEAVPLYKISAGLETGSDASLAAASRLALLNYDWGTAMDFALRRAERYNSAYSYRDYISLLHFTANNGLAWTLIDQKIQDPGGPEIWTAAYTGHRIQNLSHDAIIEWATAARRGFTGRIQGFDAPQAMRYIFLTAVIDRQPPDNLADTLRKLYPEAAWQPKKFQGGPDVPPEVVAQVNAYKGYQRLAQSAEALTAFNRGDFKRAYELLDSMNSLEKLQEFLPYYTVAALKSGQKDRLLAYLDGADARYSAARNWAELRDQQFHDNLARALVTGLSGQRDEALEHLQAALNFRPFTEQRAIFTDYQLLEVAEWLCEAKGDDQYRDFVYQTAKRFAAIAPMFPWPYAFAAKMAPSSEERIKEAAIVQMLDPGSWRLSQLPKSDRAAAREWMKEHGDPFAAPGPSAEGEQLLIGANR